MENFTLIALTGEIADLATGMVVRRIVQHHPRGFLLQSRSTRVPALKISLEPRIPALYISDAKPPIDSVGGDFLMVLRKHLLSAELLEVHKSLAERIIELTFRTSLPARELATVTLAIELMPNAPNLLLLDRERRILDTFNRLPASRGLADHDEYRYPETLKRNLAELGIAVDPVGDPKDEMRAALDAALEVRPSPGRHPTLETGPPVEVKAPPRTGFGFDPDAYAKDPKSWLIRNISGVGPLMADEIVHRQRASGRSPFEEIREMLRELGRPGKTVWLYSEHSLHYLLETNDVDALSRSIVSPLELEALPRAYTAQTYKTMLIATRTLYDELETRMLLDRAKAPRLRKLRDQRRRLEKRRQHLAQRRKQFEETSSLQETAQLLVGGGVEMDRRQEQVEVTDYGDGSPRLRTITLDPTRTIRENANRMFKQHQKATRGMRMLDRQDAETDAAEAKLATEENRIRIIGDWNSWYAFAGGARGTSPRGSGNGSGTAPRPEEAAEARPRTGRSMTIRGYQILVGRNGRENDELTFRVASPDDFWLHVADYSGSHVIVRNPSRDTDLDGEVLERAAALAAYHSQARNSRKVPVHYTQRKFVRKPRRTKPGMVELKQFRTVTVEPHDWNGTEQ